MANSISHTAAVATGQLHAQLTVLSTDLTALSQAFTSPQRTAATTGAAITTLASDVSGTLAACARR
jgi:hypothetical protein